MFAAYLIAAFLNVLMLPVVPMLGITVWLPITSGALCLVGAYNHKGR